MKQKKFFLEYIKINAILIWKLNSTGRKLDITLCEIKLQTKLNLNWTRNKRASWADKKPKKERNKSLEEIWKFLQI